MFHTLFMLKQGGWTMLPLFICSIIALTIIIERALALRWKNVIDPKVLRILSDYEGEAAAQACMNACQRCSGAYAQLVVEVLKSRNLDFEHWVENMHAAGRAQVIRLERGLTTLEIIGGISPLLGLLGTVLGMMDMFNAISIAGLGNPQILSDGIAKALITTMGGLVIAIPAVAFHSLFAKRVEELATEMQDQAMALIHKLSAQRNGK
jgi:biopolymer transport protein ExbB